MADNIWDNYVPPQEVWNPKLKANVYTGGQNQSYLQEHAQDYTGYTGAVTHAQNRPITYSGMTGNRTAPPPKAGVPDYEDYSIGAQQSALNPYDTNAQARMNAYQTDAMGKARVVPGTRPNVGFIPGLGPVDLRNFLPFDDWSNTGSKAKDFRADPIEMRMAQIASDRNLDFPTLKSVSWDKGNNPAELFGRGFHYRGAPSTQEQQLSQALMAGQDVDMNALAQLRRSRIARNELSGIQKIASKYYGPALLALNAAAGSMAGPWYGAGMGALVSGTGTKWKNPAAVAIGAGAGALGGWGAGQAAKALQYGPTAAGAMSGAGGGVASSTARGAASGDLNPLDVARSAVVGGAGGAAGGALTGGEKPIMSPVYNPFIGAGTNFAADLVWPRRRPRNPYDTPSER